MPRMKARRVEDTVTILPPGLPRQDTLFNGREKLLRDLNLEIDGELFKCPEGFDHNGSSWPRCVPGPRQSRIKLAGIVHDYACRFATFGHGGREIGYMETNRLWYKVARAGNHPDASAGPIWAWVGRIGLFIGCGPTWIRYRRRGSK